MSITGDRLARLIEPFIEANREAAEAYAVLRRSVLVDGEITQASTDKLNAALDASKRKIEAAYKSIRDYAQGEKPADVRDAVSKMFEESPLVLRTNLLSPQRTRSKPIYASTPSREAPMHDIVQLEEEARKLGAEKYGKLNWSRAVDMAKDALDGACIFGTPKHDDDFIDSMMNFKDPPEDFVEPLPDGAAAAYLGNPHHSLWDLINPTTGLPGTISGRLSHSNPCKEIVTHLDPLRRVDMSDIRPVDPPIRGGWRLFSETYSRHEPKRPSWQDLFEHSTTRRMDAHPGDPFHMDDLSKNTRYCLTRDKTGISFFKTDRGGWRKDYLSCINHHDGSREERLRFITVSTNPKRGQRFVYVVAHTWPSLDGPHKITRDYDVMLGRSG